MMPGQPIQKRIERIREDQKIDDDGQRDQDEKGLGAVSGDFPGFRHSARIWPDRPRREPKVPALDLGQRAGRCLLRVALRSQPIDAAGPLKPFVNFGFALEALDISRLGAGILGDDLPIALGDPLHFERHTNLSHACRYARSGQTGKPLGPLFLTDRPRSPGRRIGSLEAIGARIAVLIGINVGAGQ